jgi:hypothetical protein
MNSREGSRRSTVDSQQFDGGLKHEIMPTLRIDISK